MKSFRFLPAALLFDPLIPMNALGVFPRNTRRVVQVSRENLWIDLREPVGDPRRRCFFRRDSASCRGVLPCIFDPAVLCRLPVDFLKIEIAEAVEILGELSAASLESGHAGEARWG